VGRACYWTCEPLQKRRVNTETIGGTWEHRYPGQRTGCGKLGTRIEGNGSGGENRTGIPCSIATVGQNTKRLEKRWEGGEGEVEEKTKRGRSKTKRQSTDKNLQPSKVVEFGEMNYHGNVKKPQEERKTPNPHPPTKTPPNPPPPKTKNKKNTTKHNPQDERGK